MASDGPPAVDAGLGAPPEFGGDLDTGTTSGATLYGVVPDDALDLDDLDAESLPSSRASKPGSSSPHIGVPRDDDDALLGSVLQANTGSDDYGELDLPMPGDDIELDLPDAVRRPQAPLFAPPKSVGAPPSPATPRAAPQTAVAPAARAPAAPSAAPGARAAARGPATVEVPARGPAPMGAPPARGPTPTTARGPIDAPPGRSPLGAPPAHGSVGAPPAARAPSAAQRPTVGAPVQPPPRAPAQPASAPRTTASAIPSSGRMSAPVAPPPVAPRGVTPPRVPSPADTSSPDLPTPVERPTAMAFKVPTVDLPTPARPSSAGGFRTPEPPPFSPSSSSGSAPLVADFGNDAGMISVADLDLPTPVELDLPTPAGVVDLPTPIGLDLPTPAGAGLLQPATGLLTPADQAVQPAHNLPGVAEQGVQPAGRRAPQPRDLAEAASASSTDAGERAFDPVGARRSPAPRAIEHGGNRRPLILGLAGLALIGAVGGGMYAIGVFDPPIDDIPVATGRRKPSDGKNGDTTQPATPSATASERNAAVLALLARDTPEGYIEAITVAEQAGDPVGQAEAALLLHLRYGPDPARKAQAATWLEPYAKQADPFVVRVLGLVALGSGALAQADTMLVGDDSRLRLYRGWLRLRQGKANDAASEADAMRAIKPDDVGALVLQHAARAQLDPIAELAKLEASIDAHRGHPGLLAVGVRAATASGELRRARAWLEQIGEQAGTSKGWAASKLRLRADIEVAAGLLPTAVRLLDEAIALDPEDRELALARVRVLLDAGRIADAESTMRKLLETKPDDVDALTMRAEIRVAAGKGDEALAELDAIEKVAPGRARTSYLLGLVYSARAQTEQGRTAFAAAIQRDPTLLEAQIAEARVLAEGAKIGEAIALLDTARKQAADRSNERDEATVLRNKATLLVKAGQNAAAAAALDDAIAANGRDNAAQLARGLMRLEQGDAAGARADLFAVYERAGAIAGLTAPLARILVREGALDELEKLVGDQLDDAETLPELLLVGARLRLAQGKHDEAKALLQRVFETLPNDWEANLLLAQAMLDSGDRVGALAQIDRSTPAVPTAEKHLLRGKILEHNGKHDEARPEYLKALQIDAADHEARFLYGRLLAYSGESRAAADELGKVVAAAPDRFPDAWLNLGRAQRELGEQSNALASLTKAVALDENLFEAHYIIGRIRYEENDMAKAIAALEKATDERAKDTKPYIDAFLFLGRAQAKAGQNKAAAASFRKFLEIAPADHSGRADAERQVKALR